MTLQAFIFDMDGVITNTTEYHYLSWKRLTEEEGIPFTREDNEALLGLSRGESLDRILKGRTLDEATRQDWLTRKNAYYHEYLKQLGEEDRLPGITDLLHGAREAGYRLGVASSSRNARAVLEKLSLLEAFDVIGDGYSVVNTKPAPDIFIWVAGGLGVSPDQALVFEDSEAGIEAAHKGGFWTVGVGDLPGAHVTVASLSSYTLSEILAALNAVAQME